MKKIGLLLLLILSIFTSVNAEVVVRTTDGNHNLHESDTGIIDGDIAIAGEITETQKNILKEIREIEGQ